MTDYFQTMHKLACEARLNAYVPYLDFKVGTCLLSDDHEFFTGCNFQNSSLPHGQCGESNAIGKLITAGKRMIKAVVIVADSDSICSPCGGCRQQLAEFCQADTTVYLCDLNNVRQTITMAELLPNSFSADTMVNNL